MRNLSNVQIKLKNETKPLIVDDFYFDAYSNIRYCSNKILHKKNGKYIVVSTINAIPLSNIEKITFNEETELRD